MTQVKLLLVIIVYSVRAKNSKGNSKRDKWGAGSQGGLPLAGGNLLERTEGSAYMRRFFAQPTCLHLR